MKRIIFTTLAICSTIGLIWADEPVCPPAATSTTTISFKRTLPSILPGKFTVAAGKQVYFTKGNLQYNPAYNSWRFAENQYGVIGNAAGNNTAAVNRSTVDAWMDLFGFATSGYDRTSTDLTAANFQPWASSKTDHADANNKYYYGPSTAVLSGSSDLSSNAAVTGNYDWGVYNFTSGTEAGCRTLTKAEFQYLFNTRGSSLYGMGSLLGHKGIFLLPDDWNWETMSTVKAARDAANFTWTGGSTSFNKNVIANDETGRALWQAMEDAGAVFLPAGGWRDGVSVNGATIYGFYWTSTTKNASEAYYVYFAESTLYGTSSDRSTAKYCGGSVRLVKDVPAVP